jgi:hypothetical protein
MRCLSEAGGGPTRKLLATSAPIPTDSLSTTKLASNHLSKLE